MAVILTVEGDGAKKITMVLTRWTKALEDMEPAMRSIGEYQARVVNARTFNEQGPDGDRWQPLSPGYAAWKQKKRPGKPLMVFDGDLRDSLTTVGTGGGTFVTTHNTVVVGTSVPYARYHQDGAGHLPQRKLLGNVTRPDRKAMAKFIQQFLVEGVAAGGR